MVRSSFAFWMSSLVDFHSFSESGYPSHFTKNCCLDPFPRWARMASISYSSSPSMISGGGWANDGPCSSVCLKGVRSDAWKTG